MHDHYHLSHRHVGGITREWRHETAWHTDSHNRAQLMHSHDSGTGIEQQDHS
ncbi:MAG: hypothetical protein IVW36_02105 [Dehalococcoidia bacterium]|nr:hypothetical protein [Dehalococcoidia bacterium]